MKQRVRFSEVFLIQNGMISPRVPVYINGITMGPGVGFGAGVSFGGFDIASIAGKDLDVEVRDGVVHLMGYFPY